MGAVLDHEQVLEVPASIASSPQAAGRAVFAAWARRLPKAPRDAASLVRAVEARSRLVARQDTAIEGRRLSWRTEPFRGRGRVNAPARDPAEHDAWAPPPDLEESSRHIDYCATCEGSGKVGCAACAATGQIRCGHCRGSGQVWSNAQAGRKIRCRGCGGDGLVACGLCSRGKVECATCEGKKRVERWLVVEAWRRSDGQVDPDDVARAFRWGRDGETAPRAAMERDATVRAEAAAAGPLREGDLPGEVPVADRTRLLAALRVRLEPGERIVHQTLAVLEVPSLVVTYAVARRTATIDLMGKRLLAPPVTAERLLRARSRTLNVALAILLALPALLAIAYATRGAYFASAAAAAAVAAATGAGLVVYAALWNATLGRGARRWLAALPVPVTAACGLALLAEPSLGAARRHLRAGDLAAAEAELVALGDEPSAGLAPTYAALRLAQIEATPDPAEASRLLERVPASQPQRAAAAALVDARWVSAAEQALRAQRPDRVEELIGHASEGARAAAPSQALLGDADIAVGETCRRDERWACAFERAERAAVRGHREAAALRNRTLAALREAIDAALNAGGRTASLPQRVTALTRAESLLVEHQRAAPETGNTELAAVRRRLAADRAALERQVAAEEKQRRAAEARAARQRAAAEAREARRLRSQQTQSRPERSCCKVCSRGCPCGDSCISCSKTCHKGPGCAC